MYLDSAASQIYRKASGAWQSLVGLTGSDGATWLSGSGEPSGSAGADGDYYLDTGTTAVWKRVSGSWTKTIAKLRSGSGDAAELATLTIDSGELWPPFSPAVLAYRAVLPAGASLVPALSGTAKTAGATVTPTQATALSGAESARTATLKVDATDPDTGTACTLTYKVVFQVPEAAVAWRVKEETWYDWSAGSGILFPTYTDRYIYNSEYNKYHVARIRSYSGSSNQARQDFIRDANHLTLRRENWSLSTKTYSGYKKYTYNSPVTEEKYDRIDYYNSSDAATAFELYSYDSALRTKHYEYQTVGTPNVLLDQRDYSFDAQGRESGGTFAHFDGTTNYTGTMAFAFDAAGRVQEVRYLNASSVLVGRDLTYYDAAGNAIRVDNYWVTNGLLLPIGRLESAYEAYTPVDGAWSSNDAALKSLSIGQTDIALRVGTYAYAIALATSTSSVTISAVTEESHATLWHDNASFTGSFNAAVTPGADTDIWLCVRAQDGETVKPYKLTITVP